MAYIPPNPNGSATSANSSPVVLASDQASIPVAATLNSETTKVIGVTRNADGSGNLLTSTSNALDINIKTGNPTSITANAGTNLNTSALALETGGNLATISGTAISQEATTSGVKGVTAFGAVTTAKPSYTTAKSDALSLDTSGLLRVSLADTLANTNKFLVTPDSVALPANQSVNISQVNSVTPLMGNGTTGTGSLRVTLASDTTSNSNAFLVAGNKTNNNAAPAATQLGVMPVLANAAAPTWTEGDQALESADLSGNQRTTLGTLIAGEDLTNNVIRTEQHGTYAHISTATTTTVKSGAGFLYNVSVNSLGTVASTCTVYDNTAGSGTVIGVINTLALSGTFLNNLTFSTGLTLVTTGTVAPDITVSYR